MRRSPGGIESDGSVSSGVSSLSAGSAASAQSSGGDSGSGGISPRHRRSSPVVRLSQQGHTRFLYKAVLLAVAVCGVSVYLQLEANYDAFAAVVDPNVLWHHRQVLIRNLQQTDVAKVHGAQSHNYEVDKSTNSRFAVFYHVDTSQASASNASLSIIQHQLQQVGSSYAAEQEPLHLRYSRGWTDTFLKQECARYPYRLACWPLEVPVENEHGGDEHGAESGSNMAVEVHSQIQTLQSLYEYCQEQPDPDSVRVAFLHSGPSRVTARRGEDVDKISYGRPHTTAAAMSQECWEPPESKCHVCGLHFWTNWAMLFPGSQWTAKCSYVNTLIPPNKFEEKTEAMVKEALLMRLREKLFMTLFPDDIDRYPIGESAAEQWIGSHPSIRPCDLSKTKNLNFWLEEERDTANEFHFAMAPRQQDFPWDLNRKIKRKLRGDKPARMKEYYYLAGKLFQWGVLYNSTPPSDSWVWPFYRDGEEWKQGVEEHGKNVIEVLTGDKVDSTLIDNGLEGRSITEKEDHQEVVDFRLDESSPPFAVFYNLYIPKDNKKRVKIKDLVQETGISFAVDIVKEQMEQIGKSYAATSSGRLQLFYNVIGNGDALNETAMGDLCAENGFDCRLMRHYHKGGEDKTLQRIYEFCHDQEDEYRVAYVHSKGTFHKWEDGRNDRWRRHGTAAATGEMCLNPGNNTCNVCGLQFWTKWSFMYPGNFFTAQCSYVKKLIPPQFYEDRITELTKDTLLMRLKGSLLMNLFSDRIDRYGLYRYAMEAWIGSHPSIKPCDVSKTKHLMFWLDEDQDTEDEFEFAMAPRQPDAPFDLDEAMEKKVLANKELRMKEYYLLAGKIVRWYTLYGSVPSHSSWVWQWFPDGEEWRKGTELYGKNVVETLNGNTTENPAPDKPTKNTRQSQSLTVSAHDEKEPQGKAAAAMNMVNTSATSFAVFYHVYIPSNEGEDGVQNALRIVEEQIGQIGNSYAGSALKEQTVVHYSTIGSQAVNSSQFDAICEMNNLDCQHMQHLDEGDEEATLQRLHGYCQNHEAERVIYMHSKGTYHNRPDGDNERWRRIMTEAVTSELCVNPPDDSCNLCGLIFYTQWTMFMPGNFWTADCSYVNRLSRPDTFEKRMTELTQRVMLNRLRKKFATNLFDDREDHFGIGRYSMEHWVGSHPSIQPCDLSNKSLDLADWTQTERSANEFQWAMAPRRKVAPIDNKPEAQERVYNKRDNRMREYFLLPGNIFKWWNLYDIVPADDSWVWKWYPDGDEWRNGSTLYGRNVTDVLTKDIAEKVLYS